MKDQKKKHIEKLRERKKSAVMRNSIILKKDEGSEVKQ